MSEKSRSVKCLPIRHADKKIADLVLVDDIPRWFWMEDGRQFWIVEEDREEYVRETLKKYQTTQWWNFWDRTN